jgi:hypothetical protein
MRNKNIEPDFKDIEIEGVRYRVEKIPAMTGCWIATQLFTKMMPMGMETQAGIENLPNNRPSMTEQEFYDLQSYCLMACKRYETVGSTEVAMPVMSEKGKFAIPELIYDLTTIIGLTVHVLAYNVSTFFKGGALKALVATFKDLAPFSTPV